MAIEQRTGTAATLAIIAAIGGFILIFTGNPGWGLIVEFLAGVLGAVGLLMAASPRVSGGMLSIAAIVLAVIGLGISVLALIGSIVF
ncbi:MAG TPA: hypothetical protein VHM64_20645 [Candidatus Binatia bacterium]|nr:hypothetical protein [Candidatus Binatia bacterium]